MKKMAKIARIMGQIVLSLTCATGLLGILFVSWYYLTYMGETTAVPGQSVQVDMRTDVNQVVHYRDSSIFEEGPQPTENIQYLTYFTEHIEAASSFRANFSRPVNVAYKFMVTATLTIKREGAAGGTIYNQIFLIDEDYEDIENTTSIYNFYMRRGETDDEEYPYDWYEEDYPPDWDADPEEEWLSRVGNYSREDGELPGGVVEIDIEEYLDIIDELVAELAEGTGTILNNNAEVAINFTHRVYVKQYGLDESVTTGFVFPVRKDAYTFNSTGAVSHSAAGRFDTRAVVSEIIDDDNTPDIVIEFIELLMENESISETYVIFLAIMLVPLFAAGLYFALGGKKLTKIIFRKIKKAVVFAYGKLKPEKDMFDAEVKSVLRKYANEIVMQEERVNRDNLEPNKITDFKELLKLALLTNHPIFCYREENFAEFTVIFEGYIYCYKMEKPDKPEEAPQG